MILNGGKDRLLRRGAEDKGALSGIGFLAAVIRTQRSPLRHGFAAPPLPGGEARFSTLFAKLH